MTSLWRSPNTTADSKNNIILFTHSRSNSLEGRATVWENGVPKESGQIISYLDFLARKPKDYVLFTAAEEARYKDLYIRKR